MGGTWAKASWTPINVAMAYPTNKNRMEGMENCAGIYRAFWTHREQVGRMASSASSDHGWYLDAHTCTLYHHVEGVWTYHDAANIGRLRFQVEAHACDAPTRCSHVVEICERTRYMEIVNKCKINAIQMDVI
jgi:hypothetical protein